MIYMPEARFFIYELSLRRFCGSISTRPRAHRYHRTRAGSAEEARTARGIVFDFPRAKADPGAPGHGTAPIVVLLVLGRSRTQNIFLKQWCAEPVSCRRVAKEFDAGLPHWRGDNGINSPDASQRVMQPMRQPCSRRGFLKAGVSLPFACRAMAAAGGKVDIAVIGASTGGVAAALAAMRAGARVLLTEETDWVGGQLTSQLVPPDEHP